MPAQSRSELQQHLREQVKFLETSARLFDDGEESEAKRLAHGIRTLVHHTSSSSALLVQLDVLRVRGRHGLWFTDSAGRGLPTNAIGTEARLCLTHMVRDGDRTSAKYVPRFDERMPDESAAASLPFEDWWRAIIIRDNRGETFSRRRLTLAVANKDGGSHVDPALPGEYARLTRAGAMGMKVGDGGVSMSIDTRTRAIEDGDPELNPALASVRQIAHEVLTSIAKPFPDLVTYEPQSPFSKSVPTG